MAILDEDFKKRLKRFFRIDSPPVDIPTATAQQLTNPNTDSEIIRKSVASGVFYSKQQLVQMMNEMLTVSMWRRRMYSELEASTAHPLISASADLYCDHSVGYSALQESSVWVTSDDPKKENMLNQFLQEIGIEERIRDWASQIITYGDFFVEPIGKDGIGIAYIDDNIHPADMERIDVNGRLEGFIRTGLYGDQIYSTTKPVESPWKYVHFRTFGSTRRALNTTLGIFGDPNRRYSLDQRMLDPNRKFRITTKYGTGILSPALHIYKRLKIAEDALLMARMTRGVLWYLYKIKVAGQGGQNFDAVLSLVNEYAELLKRRASMNSTSGSEKWKDQWTGLFAQIEDVFVPETDNITLSVDKLGEEPNIRWIADIDLLENQLLGSLRTSKMMLGITDDMPGGIGENSAKRISVNFAKNVQRVQTAVRSGIKRLCQIHLAYMRMDPSPISFDVHLAEISSAEEEELKNAISTGVDVVGKFTDYIINTVGEKNVDALEMLDYVNRKFLKLDDFEISKIIRKDVNADPTKLDKDAIKDAVIRSIAERRKARVTIENTDLLSYLPNNTMYHLKESSSGNSEVEKTTKVWEGFHVQFKNEEAK